MNKREINEAKRVLTVMQNNDVTLQDLLTVLKFYEAQWESVPTVEQKEQHDNGKVIEEQKVTQLLIRLGVIPNLQGFNYLRSAILLCMTNRNYLDAITKQLYREVANAFNSSTSKVERAIRHAIERAWVPESREMWEKVLGKKITNNTKKPTNSEFLASVVEFMLYYEVN